MFGAGLARARLNIGLGRGLELLLEDSEIVEKSTGASGGGLGGKDEIVDLAEMSAPTEEMFEVFSAGMDVKVFMLETAPSDGDIRVRHWYEVNSNSHLGEGARYNGDHRVASYLAGLPLRYLRLSSHSPPQPFMTVDGGCQ